MQPTQTIPVISSPTALSSSSSSGAGPAARKYGTADPPHIASDGGGPSRHGGAGSPWQRGGQAVGADEAATTDQGYQTVRSSSNGNTFTKNSGQRSYQVGGSSRAESSHENNRSARYSGRGEGDEGGGGGGYHSGSVVGGAAATVTGATGAATAAVGSSNEPASVHSHGGKSAAALHNIQRLLPSALAAAASAAQQQQRGREQQKLRNNYSRRLSPHPNSAALTCRMEGALCADFTLDGSNAVQQRRKSQAQSRHRRCCRWALVLMALGVFIGVMVAVSWYITGGKRVFGPM